MVGELESLLVELSRVVCISSLDEIGSSCTLGVLLTLLKCLCSGQAEYYCYLPMKRLI